MADVSGKGIPAAMFMMTAKTLLKNRTMAGGSPAEILEDVNRQLCEGNDAELFVTVWFAILEISTGKGLAANAGHEHPVIRRANGEYELVVYRHSPAVATMEGMRFKEHAFELYSGDSLFVYTDGVPEATNAAEELFGTDRMLAALNREADARPKELLRNVRDDIDAFVADAPQFDDITMLGLYYEGPEKTGREVTVPAAEDQLETVTAMVDGELEKLGCSAKDQMMIDVAVEEIFVNIAHYAYAPDTGDAAVRVRTDEASKTLEIEFRDSGIPFDPLAKEDPDVTLSAEERNIGGLGIYLVKKNMDSVTYDRIDGQNVLTIKKKLG
jgi:sigma-B regulation protein RsbU (phosphoserine phosphatase)